MDISIIIDYITDCKKLNKEIDENIILELSRTLNFVDEWDKADEDMESKISQMKSDHKGRLIDIQDGCSHPIKKYVPDASGNNDSYYYCRVCRKEL